MRARANSDGRLRAADTAFHVDLRSMAPFAVLRVHGELDLSTEDQLLTAVEQAIDDGCTVVAVDLGGVPFMDCSALGTLVGAVHRLGEAAGRLVVTAVSPQVLRLLELTGTGTVVGLEHRALAAEVVQPA